MSEFNNIEMQNNEIERVQGEENRINNETERINNEAERVANEIQRMAREDIRQRFYDSFNSQLEHIMQEFNGDKFQDLINEYTNNNEILNIKRGNYEIDKQIIIPTNCKINFNGSTITRKSGSGVYDLFLCENASNISISNLKIDGNKDSDKLVKENNNHRFSGIKLKNVSNSKLENIDVINTVNAENQGSHKASGIYFENCTDIDCNNINGSYNDGTAIYIDSSKVRINNSYTHDNEGSGISSIYADDSEYHFIKAINNGYSNLSVNGKRSKVSNVEVIGSKYSGLNIGHENVSSDDTQVCNAFSSNNGYEGLTIADSVNVQVVNFITEGNERNNIRIFQNSNKCSLINIISRDSLGGQGVLIEGGRHWIDFAKIYNNANSGIYVGASAEIEIGNNVDCYNNGQINSSNSAGIVLANNSNCEIGSINCYDDQVTKTQESGIWIAGGSNHKLFFANCYNNRSHQIRQTSSPSGLNILSGDNSLYNVTSFSNNWSGFLRYNKTVNGDTVISGKLKGGDIGKSAFTLPASFRPASTMNYPSILSDRTLGVITVSSSGDIILYSQSENDINIYFKAVN